MGYVTIPSQGTAGFLDIFKGIGKKKKKVKKEADSDGIGNKLKDLASSITSKDSSDPSSRPGGGAGGAAADFVSGIPSWAIYAGAGVAVLFIIMSGKRR